MFLQNNDTVPESVATVRISLLPLDVGILHHHAQSQVHIIHEVSRLKCSQSVSNAGFDQLSLNVQHHS